MKFWKAVDGAQARLAADQAEDLRTAIKRSVDVDKVVDDWLRSHANTPSIRPSEARAWAKLNIRIDNSVTRAVWRRMLATGYVLGDDVAPVAIARSQLNKADAPDLSSIQTAINFDWSNWKAGNRAASALLQPPKGLSQLLAQTNASIAGMDATTLDRLGTVLADSLNTGASVTATAQDIVREGLASSLKVGLTAVLQDAQRAMTISRTEISRALNVSCRENYQDLGVEKYEWLALEPCDDCEENDGVVIALGDEFPSGDTEPPVHPNCRCTILPVIDEGTPAIEDQSEGDVVDEELTGDVAPEMQDASDLISVDTHPDLTVETTGLETTVANFKTSETLDAELGLENFQKSEYQYLPEANLKDELAEPAIEYYKTDGYKDIQDYLRFGDMTDVTLDNTPAANNAYGLNRAMTGQETNFDTIVTRGQDFGGFFQDEQTVLNSIGTEFTEKGFTSTSAFFHEGTPIVNEFLADKKINISIYVPRFTKGITIEKFETGYNVNAVGEAEFILGKGTDYKVVDAWKDADTGKLNVKLLIVGQR